MSRYTVTVPVQCPSCEEYAEVELSVLHDPGCWRTKNGDGWPESWEYDVLTKSCPCGACISEAWDDRLDNAFNTHRRPDA